MIDFKDWKIWLVVAAGIVAMLLPLAVTQFQHSQQDTAIVQQYLSEEEENTIDVYVYTDTWENAKQILAIKYDGYVVEEYIYVDSKKAFFVRLKKVKK